MKMKDTGNTFLALDSALKGMCFFIFYSHFLHLPSWRQPLLNTVPSIMRKKRCYHYSSSTHLEDDDGLRQLTVHAKTCNKQRAKAPVADPVVSRPRHEYGFLHSASTSSDPPPPGWPPRTLPPAPGSTRRCSRSLPRTVSPAADCLAVDRMHPPPDPGRRSGCFGGSRRSARLGAAPTLTACLCLKHAERECSARAM